MKVKYFSDDGREFLSEEDAKNYEEQVLKKKIAFEKERKAALKELEKLHKEYTEKKKLYNAKAIEYIEKYEVNDKQLRNFNIKCVPPSFIEGLLMDMF